MHIEGAALLNKREALGEDSIMNIFNRRELYVTMDLMKLNEVINMLKKENIPFSYKTQNSTSLRRRSDSVGLNSNGLFLYYIYVHKDRLAEAQSLLK
jgi:hypothetical protein